MLYRIERNVDCAKLYREPRSRSKLPYRTAKEMRELYPDGGFNIIGEIGGFACAPDRGDFLIEDNGNKIPIHPRGSLIPPFEWVAGYIPVGKSSYLAVIRSLLCWLIFKKQKYDK